MTLAKPISASASVKTLITALLWLILFGNSLADPGEKYIPGQLFVKIVQESSQSLIYDIADNRLPPGLENIIVRYGISKISKPFILDNDKLQSTYLLLFDPKYQVTELISELENLDFIEYAEGVPAYEFSYSPNDLHPNQWHLGKVSAELAWDVSTSSTSVVIAMVDDAVLLSHEDLSPIIWVNPGEIPGNFIDDDGNGYVDDVNGWDAADNDNNPNPLNPTNSYFTHGTHCAGLAAAKTDNNIGIASIAFDVRLMPVKIGADANSLLYGAYQGVAYAIAANADIISMSWGGGGYSQTYQNLYDMAHNQGIVLIAAAGNSNSSVPFYPAAYDHVISVGATDNNDQKTSFSNYGATIDVMAPGLAIWSSLAGSNNSYNYISGTSMACPLVSSLAALMLSWDPSLTPDELEDCLKGSCDNIDAQNPSYIGQLGTGRINAYNALQCIKPVTAKFTSNYMWVCPGDSVQFSDQSTNMPSSWNWSFPGGTPSSSLLQNPIVAYNTPGIYDATLIATNSDGTDTITKANTITAGLPTAVLSGSASIPMGFSVNLKVDLTGNPNWSITYYDGISNTTINNITNTPYLFNVAPNYTTNYTLVSVNDNSCTGSVSGSALVTVSASSSGNTSMCLQVRNYQKISDTQGNFTGILDDSDGLGFSLENIGDIDGDGIEDLVTGATGDDDGGSSSGAAWVIFLNIDGTVKSQQKISSAQGNFSGPLNSFDLFGHGVTGLGDLNNDGINDIAVGSRWDDDGGVARGALWIFFLNSNGTVKSEQKISSTQGNFVGPLIDYDNFGSSVANIGDLNGDGIIDIAVGTINDDDGGSSQFSELGATWILFLDTNGTVKSSQKISATQGNFTGILDSLDQFGNDVCGMGDLDGDGIGDITVACRNDDDGGGARGSVWILFLNIDGTVKSHQKISSTQGGFTGPLDDGDFFGQSVSSLGDHNNDGVSDLLVGAGGDDDGSGNRGAVWIIYLNSDGTVLSHDKISSTQGNFSGIPNGNYGFGRSVTSLGDLDGNGIADICVGVTADSDGGSSRGALWVLFMEDTCFVPVPPCTDIAFQKTYGGSSNDHSLSMRQTSDSGQIIAGYTQSFGAGINDVYLTKTNEVGDLIWAKTYGGINSDYGNSVEPTLDGGYIVAGMTESFGAGGGDVYLIKTDSLGNSLWSKTYGGSNNEFGRSVKQTPDSGFVVLATTESFGAGAKDLYLIKTDAGGDTLWTKTYGGSSNDEGNDIQITSDGGFILTGSSVSYGAGGSDIYMIKTDSMGNVEWTKTYGGSSGDQGFSVRQTLDNGYVLVGNTSSFGEGSSDVYLIKTNSTGDTLWTKTYGGGASDEGQTIQQTQDGGYFIAGSTYSFGAGSADTYIIRTDSGGAPLWTSCFGGVSDDFGYCAEETSDSMFIVTGRSLSFGSGNIYLIKMNNYGNSGCNQFGTNTIVGNTSTSINSGVLIGTGAIIGTPATITTTTATIESTLCFDSTLCDSISLPDVINPSYCNLQADFTTDAVCFGDSTSFINLSTDNITNIVGWRWYFGDGDSLIGVQNPKHLYGAADTFSVMLIISNDSTPSCMDTVVKSILVIDTLIVIAPIADSICLGDNIDLGPLSIICGTAPFTYDWSPGSSLDDSGIANPTASPLTTTTYYILITDSTGMTSTDSVTIYVDIGCCQSWALIGSDTNYCFGDSVYFINNSISSLGAIYTWDFGTNSTPSSFVGTPPPPVYFDTSGVLQIMLILTDSCGVDTAYHNVNIYPAPIANAGADTTLCLPDTLQIGATPISNHFYFWVPITGLSDSTIANPTVYIDSTITYLITDIDNLSGCSNTDTITITGYPAVIADAGSDATFCQEDSLQLNAMGGVNYVWSPVTGLSNTTIADPWASPMNSITYFLTVSDTNGCLDQDSVSLTINPTFNIILTDVTICPGDSALLFGSYQSQAGTYLDSSLTINNCDSIMSTLLIVNLSYYISDTSITICNGDSILIYGNYIKTPGLYYDSLITINGCDSVHSTALTINPTYSNTDPAIDICIGDSVLIYGTYRAIAATYYDSLLTTTGCDSIHSTILSIQPTYNSTDPAINICFGDSVLIYGTYRVAAATYYDSLLTTTGCDSIHSTMLSINPAYNITDPAVYVCPDDSALVYGIYRSAAGIYYDILTTIDGCDSVHSTVLSINPVYSITDPAVYVCPDDSALIYGIYRSASGTYYDSSITIDGCDSVHSTVLSINSIYDITDPAIDICAGDSILIYGTFRTIEATYYDSLLTTDGCDSINSTMLAVNPTYTTTTQDESICDGDSILLFGVYRKTPGIYDDGLSTTLGCDSITSTTLSVNTLPTVGFSGLDSVYCSTHAGVTMIGTPSGGTFSGTGGIVGNQFFPATGVNMYSITYSYTDSSGCSNSYSQSVIVEQCIGIPDREAFGYVYIYPNPSTGKFTIQFTIIPQETTKLKVFNNLGQVVFSETLNLVQGTSTTLIDLCGNPAGIYNFQLQTESEIINRQVIIE